MPGLDDTSNTPEPQFGGPQGPSDEDKVMIQEKIGQLQSRRDTAVEIAEKTDSAEFSVNAKGELAYKVKVYDEDVDKALERAATALVRAREYAETFKQGQ